MQRQHFLICIISRSYKRKPILLMLWRTFGRFPCK